MKYERLTIRNSDGSVSQPTHSTFEKVFNRLAELEDDLESGKIIRLPCKVGDIVYFPVCESRFDYAEIDYIHITDKEIIFEWVQYDRGYELTEVWDNGEFTLDDVGKTVFLTREEAENA